VDSMRQYQVQVHATFDGKEYLVAEVKARESYVDRVVQELRREFPEPSYTVTAWPLVWVASRRWVSESQVIGVFQSELDAVDAMNQAMAESEDEATVTALALR
jgi:hypothetical protein